MRRFGKRKRRERWGRRPGSESVMSQLWSLMKLVDTIKTAMTSHSDIPLTDSPDSNRYLTCDALVMTGSALHSFESKLPWIALVNICLMMRKYVSCTVTTVATIAHMSDSG